MASWSIPASESTGVVLPASWLADVQGDLEVLANQVGLFGTTGAIAGSSASVSAPNFLIQTGVVSVVVTSANYSITLPNAFPNGLISVNLNTVTSGGGISDTHMVLTGSTQSSIHAQCFRNGSAFTGDVEVAFTAFGC